MNSTLSLLKQEINKTNEAEHDLAKWKLAVTAALGAAAFGLGQDGSAPYWLLLFIPFVCTYVDLFDYQYQLRILVTARFLREHGQDDAVLQAYEQECEEVRARHIFSLGKLAEISCSLGACVLGPVFYLLDSHFNPGRGSLLVSPAVGGVIWLSGVLLIVFLWVYFQVKSRQLSGERASHPTHLAPASLRSVHT
jgi:hypothetical protein